MFLVIAVAENLSKSVINSSVAYSFLDIGIGKVVVECWLNRNITLSHHYYYYYYYSAGSLTPTIKLYLRSYHVYILYMYVFVLPIGLHQVTKYILFS